MPSGCAANGFLAKAAAVPGGLPCSSGWPPASAHARNRGHQICDQAHGHEHDPVGPAYLRSAHVPRRCGLRQLAGSSGCFGPYAPRHHPFRTGGILLFPGKAPGLAMVIATRTQSIHRSAACGGLVGPKVPHSRSIVAGVVQVYTRVCGRLSVFAAYHQRARLGCLLIPVPVHHSPCQVLPGPAQPLPQHGSCLPPRSAGPRPRPITSAPGPASTSSVTRPLAFGPTPPRPPASFVPVNLRRRLTQPAVPGHARYEDGCRALKGPVPVGKRPSVERS